MKEFTLTGEVITGAREKPGEGIQHVLNSESLGFWKGLLNGLKASFDAQFKSDLEKETSIHWYWSMGPL